MLESVKVSVTGDPSSGKTEACRVFRRLGAYVVSADRVSHSLLIPHTPIGKRVVNLLGDDVLVGNAFDRRLIAEKVFNDFGLLCELESILHPEICRVIETEYQQVALSGKHPVFVAEVPLLYEISYADKYDSVVLIQADEGIRRDRFLQKMGCSEKEFYQRCSRFFPYEQRAAVADVIIQNNGTIEELRQKVEEYYYSLGAI
ncbi:dephospho-CoA kinase [Chlamydiifrater volucris]|uniref:dephospho-CoA kinase n=1 Tax=Chlamydiifrater volucris TaxID=2681470 RepID=UPI001BCB2291|nr:dephospho-CoA kinase [Chlamydiifrater volucris]